MVEAGAAAEARRGLGAGRSRARRARCSGSRSSRRSRSDEAVAAVVARDPPPRPLPAQVAAPAPGRGYARRQAVHPRRSPMRSSRWQAQGNVYLVAEAAADAPSSFAAEVGDADGILEVLATAARTGSRSRSGTPTARWPRCPGNGTRIAARWLAEQTGADASRRCGSGRGRSPRGCSADGARRAGASAPVVGRRARGGRRDPLHAGRRRQPARRRRRRPGRPPRIGPLLETHPRFPNRTNVQVARRLDDGDRRGAGLGAGGGRDRVVGLERGRRRRRVGSRPGDDPLPRRRPPRPARGRPRLPHRPGRARRLNGRARGANPGARHRGSKCHQPVPSV